jgi:LPXTG-motif cell wall-anchored protein
MQLRKSLSISATMAFLAALMVPASASADQEINLIPSGSIKRSDGLIGVIGETFNGCYWTYNCGAVDVVTSGYNADCTNAWTPESILCDPAPTTNQRGFITQKNQHVGFTSSMDDQNTVSFIVIDLGQVSTFSSLEIYQMWDSDGNVSHVEMFVSSTLNDTWPVQSDISWTSVAGKIGYDAGVVQLGVTQAGSSPQLTNSAVTEFNFTAATGRYVMFYFANDGRHPQDGYIEVAGVKLFGSVGSASSTPTPTPTPTPTTAPASTIPAAALATTGANFEWLMVAGMLAAIAGAGFLTVGRRKRI